MQNKKGFTLLEVIIVIGVIAIIVAASVPRLSAYRERYIESGRESQEYTLNKALKQYYALTGGYPAKIDYMPGGTFDQTAFAKEMTAKTGVMVNLSNYTIDYNETPPEITVGIR